MERCIFVLSNISHCLTKNSSVIAIIKKKMYSVNSNVFVRCINLKCLVLHVAIPEYVHHTNYNTGISALLNIRLFVYPV
jgi:hypothetical protein